MIWQLEERQPAVHFLIHDHDSKFVSAFDAVFRATCAYIMLTPFRAPNANAYAERYVKTVRYECFNKVIILNEAHLRQVLREYVNYYNGCRPHQGLDQHTPIPIPSIVHEGAVCSRPVLGGIIVDHYRAA